MSELREKVANVVGKFMYERGAPLTCVDHIAAILEDTGAPAYMRVAADLRGEVAGED